MKVRQLRKLLRGIPADAEVVIRDARCYVANLWNTGVVKNPEEEIIGFFLDLPLEVRFENENELPHSQTYFHRLSKEKLKEINDNAVKESIELSSKIDGYSQGGPGGHI